MQNQEIVKKFKIPIILNRSMQKSGNKKTSSMSSQRDIEQSDTVSSSKTPIVRLEINPEAEALARTKRAEQRLPKLRERLENFNYKSFQGCSPYIVACNLALGITKNGERTRYHFKCHIPGCSHHNMDERMLNNHITKNHNETDWNGYCSKCHKFVYQQGTIYDELKHIKKFHMGSIVPASTIKYEPDMVAEITTISPGFQSRFIVAQPLKKERVENAIAKLLNTNKEKNVFRIPKNISPSVSTKINVITNPKVIEPPSRDPGSNGSSTFKPQMKSAPKISSRDPQMKSAAKISSRDPRIKKLMNNDKVSNLANLINVQPWLNQSNGLKVMESAHKMLQEEPLVALYKCMAQDCIFFSNNSENFFFHSSMHFSDVLSCSYCPYQSQGTQSDDYVKHFKEAHSFDIFQCGYCFYRSCSRENLLVHVKLFHSNKKTIIIIELPRQGYSEHRHKLQKEAQAYQNYTKFVPELKCLCGAEFYNFGVFKNHLSNHGNWIEMKECECGEKVSFNGLIEHNEKSHKASQLQCIYCLFGCQTTEKINQHLSVFHPSKFPFYCDRTKANPSNIKAFNLKYVQADNEDENMITIRNRVEVA